VHEWNGARDLERTDVREEASGEAGMQKWHKGTRRNPAATSEEGELHIAITPGKLNNTQQNLQEEARAGDREASCRDFKWVAKNE
jgi:hypothetical protein